MRPGKRGYSNTWEVACYYWARISLGACGSICGSGGWQALIDPRSSRCFLAAGFSARKAALCQFLLQKGRRQSWRRIRVILISDAWPHHPCSALPGSSLPVRHNLKLADLDHREQNGRSPTHQLNRAQPRAVLFRIFHCAAVLIDLQVQILSQQIKFCFDRKKCLIISITQ